MKKTAGPLIVLFAAGIALGACKVRADESHTHTHADTTGETEGKAGASAHSQADHEGDDAHHDGDHGHRDEGGHAHVNRQSTSETRQAGAHSHGNASLAVAIEGARVFFELDSPVYNLLGFEHAPGTTDEIEKHREVAATLSQPDRLFSVNAEAQCKADGPHGFDLFEPVGHDDDHGEDPSDADSDHRDVLAEYEFTCKLPNRISEIDVRLFEVFPLLTQLDAVFLGENAQRSIRLTKDNHRIATDR